VHFPAGKGLLHQDETLQGKFSEEDLLRSGLRDALLLPPLWPGQLLSPGKVNTDIITEVFDEFFYIAKNCLRPADLRGSFNIER